MLADVADFREDGAMDYDAAGLLDGLEGDERRAREQLLDRLMDTGFTLAELREAAAEDRLALLPVDRLLGGSYSAREIEARTGTPAGLLLWIRRLLGLPEAGADDRVFGEPDIEAARSTQLFVETGVEEESLVEITRVLGEGMARLAATVAASFADSFLEPGDSEDVVAQRFAALAERLMPALAPVLIAAFSAHLRESVSRGMIGRAELAAGNVAGSQEMCVCFADLVGFTRLGGEVETQELSSVAGRLAGLAAQVTTPEVRLIKTIGDAAMYVSSRPAPLVAAALELVSLVEVADLPSLRAGIAYGPALQRAGDYFGHTVNLASRVTGVARPGSVLCTAEVHEAITDEFDWSYAGRFRLKGVAEPVPCFRARPLEPAAEPADEPRPARTAKKRGAATKTEAAKKRGGGRR
jgi:adenylate cyclase